MHDRLFRSLYHWLHAPGLTEVEIDLRFARIGPTTWDKYIDWFLNYPDEVPV